MRVGSGYPPAFVAYGGPLHGLWRLAGRYAACGGPLRGLNGGPLRGLVSRPLRGQRAHILAAMCEKSLSFQLGRRGGVLPPPFLLLLPSKKKKKKVLLLPSLAPVGHS